MNVRGSVYVRPPRQGSGPVGAGTFIVFGTLLGIIGGCIVLGLGLSWGRW